ncbi:histone-lysine N-methyltransferase SETMAR [Trichonephila clavipes]|nr:histone-lysine N-methyltransferase SETMAR [Trichonephila clavipes]
MVAYVKEYILDFFTLLNAKGKKELIEWCMKEGLIASRYECPKCNDRHDVTWSAMKRFLQNRTSHAECFMKNNYQTEFRSVIDKSSVLELSDQLEIPPDLTPSDFHLFLHLKSFFAGKHFNNDKELKENVSNWLKTQAATFYEEGIEKLVPRYDTCLQNFGSYVESLPELCSLSYPSIARVGQDSTTVSRIWNQWVQDNNTERRDGSQRPFVTSSGEDRHVIHMVLMNRAANHER